jgi:hypothetical protein
MDTELQQFRQLFTNSKIGYREIQGARGPVIHITPGNPHVESNSEDLYFALRFNKSERLLDVVLKKA